MEKLESDEAVNHLFGANEISLQNQWLEIIKVENVNVTFKLDTGLQVNLLPDKIFEILKCRKQYRDSNIRLETYGGHTFKPIVLVELQCIMRKKPKLITFLIINNSTTPILGKHMHRVELNQ